MPLGLQIIPGRKRRFGPGLWGRYFWKGVNLAMRVMQRDPDRLTTIFERQDIGRTGVESGDDTRPWKLEAKDADGLVFKGGLTPVKAGYPGDTTLYMLVELKSSKVFISGPMSCLMK